jgi:hypothetical protein
MLAIKCILNEKKDPFLRHMLWISTDIVQAISSIKNISNFA